MKLDVRLHVMIDQRLMRLLRKACAEESKRGHRLSLGELTRQCLAEGLMQRALAPTPTTEDR